MPTDPDVADWTAVIYGVAAGDVTDLADWTWAVYGAGGTFPTTGGATGGAPTPPGSGYILWYDASQITGVADGAGLTTWPDLSGGRYDLTPGLAPTYHSAGATLMGGKPTVSFGAGTWLHNTAAPGLALPVVVQTALRMTALGTDYHMIFQAAGRPSFYTYPGPPAQWSEDASGSPVRGGTPDTSPHALTFVYNTGATSLIRVDGTQVVSTSTAGGSLTGTAGVAVGMAVDGVSFPLGADIGEIIVYSASTLTNAQLANNEAYLKAKWGTP